MVPADSRFHTVSTITIKVVRVLVCRLATDCVSKDSVIFLFFIVLRMVDSYVLGRMVARHHLDDYGIINPIQRVNRSTTELVRSPTN